MAFRDRGWVIAPCPRDDKSTQRLQAIVQITMTARSLIKIEMHEELLLALAGHPGDVFRWDGGRREMELISGIPFLLPPEAKILSSLAALGTHLLRIEAFLDAHAADARLQVPPPHHPPLLHLLTRANRCGRCAAAWLRCLSGIDRSFCWLSRKCCRHGARCP